MRAKKEQGKEPSMIRKGAGSPVHRREVNGWRKGKKSRIISGTMDETADSIPGDGSRPNGRRKGAG